MPTVSTSIKPDFSKYKPFRQLEPVKFITNQGKEFDVEVLKSTVACYHILLIKEGRAVNRIKVRKTNHRLRYRLDGRLLTPNEVMKRKG